jgi:hypothetical protein
MEARMNDLKRNKFIATTMLLVFVISLASLPLSAGERRGSDVVVTLTDGSKIKGELLAVRTGALLVSERAAHQGRSIELRQVAKVKVLKTFWALTGMVFGFGVGFGAAVGIGKLSHDDSKCCGDQMGASLILMSIFTLAGGIFGALKSVPTQITLTGGSYQRTQQNLEKLKRYAREKDGTKPVDLENAPI